MFLGTLTYHSFIHVILEQSPNVSQETCKSVYEGANFTIFLKTDIQLPEKTFLFPFSIPKMCHVPILFITLVKNLKKLLDSSTLLFLGSSVFMFFLNLYFIFRFHLNVCCSIMKEVSVLDTCCWRVNRGSGDSCRRGSCEKITCPFLLHNGTVTGFFIYFFYQNRSLLWVIEKLLPKFSFPTFLPLATLLQTYLELSQTSLTMQKLKRRGYTRFSSYIFLLKVECEIIITSFFSTVEMG